MKQFWMFLGCAILVSSNAADAKTSEEVLHAGTPEQQGVALATELATRYAGYRDFAGQVEMTLQDRDGSQARRHFSVKLLEHPVPSSGDYSLLEFDSPADVKGTSVLSHAQIEGEDEQWIFLPALHRVKRISSSNRTGSFVGSEFSFEDLTGNEGRKYTWKACPEWAPAATCSALPSRRLRKIRLRHIRVVSFESTLANCGSRRSTSTTAAARHLEDVDVRRLPEARRSLLAPRNAWTMNNKAERQDHRRSLRIDAIGQRIFFERLFDRETRRLAHRFLGIARPQSSMSPRPIWVLGALSLLFGLRGSQAGDRRIRRGGWTALRPTAAIRLGNNPTMASRSLPARSSA